MPEIIALFGSPLPRGNTGLLLDEAIDGATGTGCTVERVNVPFLTFEPCLESLHCMTEPECSQLDDLTPFYDRLSEVDGVIVATPVMTMGVPGKLKGFFDRFQVYYWAKYGRRAPLVAPGRRVRRHGLLIAISGLSRERVPHVFDGLRYTVDAFFDIVDVTPGEEVLIDDMDGKRDLSRFPGILVEAREAGRRLGERLVRQSLPED